MSRVRLTELAEGDLADIWYSIALESLDTADEVVADLKNLMHKLAAQPLMGRARPEAGREVRSFVQGRYVIFYRPLSDGIGVSRVIHGARDQRDLDLPSTGN